MKWFLLSLVVLGTVLGDLLKAKGMRALGEVDDFSAAGWAGLARGVARSPSLGLSLVGYTISFFGFMALVSVADVSFAAPATAAGYVVETALAAVLLGERVSVERWTGAGLVTLGVFMVGG